MIYQPGKKTGVVTPERRVSSREVLLRFQSTLRGTRKINRNRVKLFLLGGNA